MRRPEKSLPDTNAVVRYLVQDDEALSDRAGAYFARVKSGEETAVILESVLAECVYVLTKIYKVPKERVAASLKDLLRYRGVANADREALIEALTVFAERSLDIVDCLLYAKSREMRASLFSFDAALNRLAATESKRKP